MSLTIVFSWKTIGLMAIHLVALNLIDVLMSFYAISTLGLIEVNPFAVSLPLWILAWKFGFCFIPVVCAYTLHKFKMENYLLLPLGASLILIEYYIFVVAFNVVNILSA
jgi:hypothetical protein